MKLLHFEKRTRLPVAAEHVYRFHAEADALERLIPPWENTRVMDRTDEHLIEGSRVTLRIGGLPGGTWTAEITDVCPGRGFRDAMVRGPLAHWVHHHRFLPDGPCGSILIDRIEYALPMGWLGRLLGGRMVRRRLERLFNWRHARTEEILKERRTRESRSALVLLAHGSRDPAWRRTFDRLCRDIGGSEASHTVRLAFLQFDHPTLAEAVGECAEAGAERVRVLPLFLATGGHVNRDIPAQVKAIRAERSGINLELAAPLGEHPEVLTAIASAARGLGWDR